MSLGDNIHSTQSTLSSENIDTAYIKTYINTTLIQTRKISSKKIAASYLVLLKIWRKVTPHS